MKHYNSQEDTQVYFSTCTIVQWPCLFKEENYFRIIVDSLNYCIENKGLTVIGYVMMLNHLHLTTINSEETTLSNIMRDFKRHTATEIAEELEIDHAKLLLYIFPKAAEGKKKEQAYKIWQDEFHPKAIYTQDFFCKSCGICTTIQSGKVGFCSLSIGAIAAHGHGCTGRRMT